MTRPHVRKHFADFPWIPGEQLWGAEGDNPADFDIPGMGLVRVLSKDEATGAITLLIKLQAGWHTPARERHGCLQEDILIEGDCWYGDEHYEAPAYLCFPANTWHGPMRTDTGGVWIVTLDGPVTVEYER